MAADSGGWAMPRRAAALVKFSSGDGHEVAQITPVHVHNHQLSHQVLDGPPRGQAGLIASGSGRSGWPREDTMNRVWLITGANSGFGRAITEAAVAAGSTCW